MPAITVPRDQRSGRWVNRSASHSGQRRYTSAGWLAAEIDAFSRFISARSRLDRPATEIMLIDETRRRAADLGTRQVSPHTAQVRSYSAAATETAYGHLRSAAGALIGDVQRD